MFESDDRLYTKFHIKRLSVILTKINWNIFRNKIEISIVKVLYIAIICKKFRFKKIKIKNKLVPSYSSKQK